MADAPETIHSPAPTGSTAAGTSWNKKFLHVPLWGWAMGAGGLAAVGFYWWKHRKGSASTTTNATSNTVPVSNCRDANGNVTPCTGCTDSNGNTVPCTSAGGGSEYGYGGGSGGGGAVYTSVPGTSTPTGTSTTTAGTTSKTTTSPTTGKAPSPTKLKGIKLNQPHAITNAQGTCLFKHPGSGGVYWLASDGNYVLTATGQGVGQLYTGADGWAWLQKHPDCTSTVNPGGPSTGTTPSPSKKATNPPPGFSATPNYTSIDFKWDKQGAPCTGFSLTVTDGSKLAASDTYSNSSTGARLGGLKEKTSYKCKLVALPASAGSSGKTITVKTK